MRRMRWLMCGGIALMGMAPQAGAADLSDMFLRGSSVISGPRTVTWDGFYFGGHAGASWTGTDFGNATQSLVAFMLRETTIENERGVSNWATLGKAATSGASYGGFVGYQVQWDAAVVGVEAGYSRTDMQTSASDGLRRLFATSDGYNNDVQVDGTASMRVTDYGTIRAKAGWAAGNFLPYAFVGAAVARGDVTKTATVTASGTSTTGGPPYAFVETRTESKLGDFAYGYTAGLGVDMALMQNVFVRAEWEYIYLTNFNNLKTYISTARIGAGFKF